MPDHRPRYPSVRDLGRAARALLGRYDLELRRVRFLCRNTNVLFRVDTTRAPLILRIATPGWRTRASFRAGYEELLSWPEGEIDPFQAGRLLWILNWVARFQTTYFRQTFERLRPLLERFDSEGVLISRA